MATGMAYGMNFGLILVSADNLVDVRKLGKLKVYAKVSLDGLAETVTESQPDRKGRSNPRWNFRVDYLISQEVLQREPEVRVVVELKCERSLGEDKYVGRVRISLKELHEKGMTNVRSYPVEDCPDGRLHIEYSFSNPGIFSLPPQNPTAPNHNQSSTGLHVAQAILEVALVIFHGTMVLLGV